MFHVTTKYLKAPAVKAKILVKLLETRSLDFYSKYFVEEAIDALGYVIFCRVES